METFADRTSAGRALAQLLQEQKLGLGGVVLGLPRGGVPVALEVAKALGGTLDVWPVRKLGVPRQPELAMGAVAMGGGRYVNQRLLEALEIGEEELALVEAREREELRRRVALYRGSRPLPQLEHRAVILVDDGLATGATVRAALDAVRRQNPAQVVVAVPVAAPDSAEELEHLADAVVALRLPRDFQAVGQFYQDFPQVSDREVLEALAEVRGS